MRAFALALALAFAAAGCGKYGPPVRSQPVRPAKTPPVTAGAGAAAATAEECPDPNAPVPERTP